MKRDLVIIAHNIRSAHNVGSLLRTADGMGVSTVYLTGYTPYPKSKNDNRLPHLADKIERRINKTSLGAEYTASWIYEEDISKIIEKLKARGYEILALEQANHAVALDKYMPATKIAIILGNEVTGIEPEVLKLSDQVVSIPMLGSKESYNVVQATAMALYRFRFF